jgi:nucleoside 2-deoxyribosyltransferase
MKIYLAARYSRRLELCEYRSSLEALGHEVTSRWLNGKHQVDRDGLKLGALGEEYVESGSDEQAAQLRDFFATEDMQDVRSAELMIAFTEQPRADAFRGGRHVEAGMALAWGIPLWVVGPRENVFYSLSSVAQHEAFADVAEKLGSVVVRA